MTFPSCRSSEWMIALRSAAHRAEIEAAAALLRERWQRSREILARVAEMLATMKTDPEFEHCRFSIEVGVRLDCGANVEADMLRVVAEITEAMPSAPTAEPWRSAWEAAVDAACERLAGG